MMQMVSIISQLLKRESTALQDSGTRGSSKLKTAEISEKYCADFPYGKTPDHIYVPGPRADPTPPLPPHGDAPPPVGGVGGP